MKTQGTIIQVLFIKILGIRNVLFKFLFNLLF